MTGKAVYRIYKRKRGWRWELRAPNHEVVARGGEPFVSLANVKRAVRRTRQYAVLGKVKVEYPRK